MSDNSCVAQRVWEEGEKEEKEELSEEAKKAEKVSILCNCEISVLLWLD